MNFLHPDIDQYASRNSAPETALLTELSRETHLKTTMPRMLSGHLQGRFLAMLSALLRAENILEIGTFTGYSTLCLAEGLSANGKIYSIDSNDETTSIAKKYVKLAGLESKIELITGNAMEIIPAMQQKFDLVFIDADKENYSNYYNMIIGQMKPGGLIVADNVLWSGKVIEEIKPNDKETNGLIHFTKMVCADERVSAVLLPVRDGLMLLRVK